MESPSTDHPIKPLLKRILIPLLIGLSLLILGFFIAQTTLYQRQLNISSQQLVQNTLRTLELTIDKETELLVALEEVILNDPDILRLLQYQNRGQLLAKMADKYAQLKENQSITHFYFHKPNGTNLVRLHQPDRYGDVINRLTLQQARITRKVASGLEMGPLGTFTLRVVTPVIEEDRIIGFMELGKEIEVILAKLETLGNVDIAFSINKDSLQQKTWEKIQFLGQNRYPWERYTHFVLSYTSRPEIAEILDEFQLHDDHFHRLEDSAQLESFELTHQHDIEQMFEINYLNKPAILTTIPLEDASGQQHTNLILIHDISTPVNTFKYLISITAGAAFIVFIIITGFLVGFLKRTDQSIAKQQQDLLDTTDLLNKARTVTNEGIWDWNLQTHEVTFDGRYYTMAGYSPNEFPSSYQNWRNRLHPDDLVMAEQAAKDFIEGNLSKYDIEFRFRCKDGSYIWIRARARIFAYDDRGKPLRIVGTHTDVSDRRLVQASLLQSEEKFSKAFYQQDVAMELVDLEQGLRLDFNDKYCQITGYSRAELLDSSIYEKNLWIDPQGQLKAAEELKSKGILSEFPMDIVQKSGVRKNLLLSAAKLDLAIGQNIVIATLVDISHLKAAEEALRESETRFRMVFNQQYQFIAILSPEGITQEINDLPLQVTGFSRSDFVGKPFWETPAWKNLPDWEDKWRNRLYQAADSNDPIHTEDIYQNAEGITLYANTTTSAIKDSEGKVLFYLIEATDTTKRRQAEQQRDELLKKVQQLNVNLELRVKQRTAELKAVNNELEAFSYSVSHDLRAPLRSIDGFSQALLEDYGGRLDEEGHDYLNRVRNSAQRMGQLIDDLLQLSRVNREDISHQQVDMKSLAIKVIEELRSADPQRQVEFIPGEELSVEGDERLLRIMLDNLLGNAWKFTANQEHAQITFNRSTEDPMVFLIKDNGVGFDMKYADKLFGAFQRLHRITEFPGTGIGLATVQRIMHRHGGKIWAEAEVGKGATFYFSFVRTKKKKISKNNQPKMQHGES